MQIENVLEDNQINPYIDNELLIVYFILIISYQDYVKFEKEIKNYEFRGKKFVLEVFNSVENFDSNLLSQKCSDYDRFDPLQVKILLYIKNSINTLLEEDLT